MSALLGSFEEAFPILLLQRVYITNLEAHSEELCIPVQVSTQNSTKPEQLSGTGDGEAAVEHHSAINRSSVSVLTSAIINENVRQHTSKHTSSHRLYLTQNPKSQFNPHSRVPHNAYTRQLTH
uniref:Uncharacterized protein n=1 Tax=Graphocephala atropunctata TaxID=36148 RepID=A0A1B6L1I6_9HEMI